MYDYLLDCPDQETVQPRIVNGVGTHRTDSDVFTSRYQRERQRVYDRAHHMVNNAAYAHSDVEDAKAEAALVRAEAQVSRVRGDQLGWVRHMLRRGAPARFGYRNPTQMVASRLDVRRSTARELVYLAERLGDHQIDSVRQGAVSYERILAETRLAEAGVSPDVIERSGDLDLDSTLLVAPPRRRTPPRHAYRPPITAPPAAPSTTTQDLRLPTTRPRPPYARHPQSPAAHTNRAPP